MLNFRRAFSVTALSACFMLTGCKDELKPGHYEGNLFKKYPKNTLFEAVNLEVTYPSPHEAKMIVRNQLKNRIAEATLMKAKNGQLDFKLMGIENGHFRLDRVAKQSLESHTYCYSDLPPERVQLCYNHEQFSLRFMDSSGQSSFTLSGNQFKKEEPFPLESPKEVALAPSIDEAFKNNFDSKIAFQHVFQAKNAAMAAWLNLLPHLTANLIWHAPIPTYISAVAVLQGLTPFLLPTFYMDAKSADYNVKIQRDALMILQADLATNLEQLFYTHERDSKIVAAHEKILKFLEEFEVQLRTKNLTETSPETQALLDAKSTLVEALQTTLSGVTRVLTEDRYALSLALGKHNPDAISNTTLGLELDPIEKAKLLDQAALADTATQRSFEIQQLDYLIKTARLKKIELFFYWMDPSADQHSSLGFNLIGQEKIAKSQIEELMIKREQLKSTLYQNSYRLVLDYNDAVNNHRKLRKSIPWEAQMIELEKLLRQDTAARQLTPDDLKTAVQGLLTDLIQYESILAAFRVARAKVDRLLLRGYFERLLPHLPVSTF